MNTLPRAVTARFSATPSEYEALRRHWSGVINSDARHDLRAEHHILYQVLLGRDWRRGFTPPTNLRKLLNGAFHGWSLWQALARLHSEWHAAQLLEPFGGLVTPDMLNDARAIVPHPNPNHYQPTDFAPGRFPFDAYTVTTAAASASAEPSNG